MARNEEKAQSMLYRFRQAQAESLGITMHIREKRPADELTVDDLSMCEKWRFQIIREITKKVSKIQDTSLTEFEIRDLNDEINKLIREKRRWEERIRTLGGPDYKRIGAKTVDQEGKEVPGSQGYKYFGRAKDLPGVRELFATEVINTNQKTRFELYRNIDADYYGYRDEENDVLLTYENDVESQLKQHKHGLFIDEAEIENFGKQKAKV